MCFKKPRPRSRETRLVRMRCILHVQTSVGNESLEVEFRVNDVESRVKSESFRATNLVKSICNADFSQVESVYIETLVESRKMKPSLEQ